MPSMIRYSRIKYTHDSAFIIGFFSNVSRKRFLRVILSRSITRVSIVRVRARTCKFYLYVSFVEMHYTVVCRRHAFAYISLPYLLELLFVYYGNLRKKKTRKKTKML